MAYAFSMVVGALVAVSSQLAGAEPIVLPPGQVFPNPSNTDYNPNQCQHLLQYPPFYYFCDYDFSFCIDANVQARLESLAAEYGLRLSDLQQLNLLVESVMPNLGYDDLTDMLTSLSASIKAEMQRRDLAYVPEYPWFCPSTSNPGGPLVNPMYPSSALYPSDVLVRRNVVVPETFSPLAATGFYDNMINIMNKAMPNLSPQLQRDILNSIYQDTPLEYYSRIYQLNEKLKMNIRSMISGMWDYTPVLY